MIAIRKLYHYFQAYSIAILTDQPLKQILQWPDTFEWLLKCSIELSEFHISYWARMAIKAQTLTDLIADMYDIAPNPKIEAPKEQNQDGVCYTNWI